MPDRSQSTLARAARRLRLRHVLFLCLLLPGIIPLAISSAYLIRVNRSLLEDQESGFLVRDAESVSRQVDSYLAGLRRELEQLGTGLLTVPGPERPADRLRQGWVESYLAGLAARPGLQFLRILDAEGVGPSIGAAGDLPPLADQALDAAFVEALATGQPVYRLVVQPLANDPLAVLAVPVPGDAARVDDVGVELVFEAIHYLPLLDALLGSVEAEETAVMVTGADGEVLWSRGVSDELLSAVLASDLLEGFRDSPLHFTRTFEAELDGKKRTVAARVSKVEECGWGVVVLKPNSAVGVRVDRMLTNAFLSSVLLVILALLFAAAVARWVGQPINRLAETSDDIASGNFGQRVELSGLSFEMADLAANFNRMSGHVESYIERLRQAAAANRELFIGSIRAFAAAIDAKDPYTRGHSERVAAVARLTARQLGLDEETQQRAWLGGVLHDVGKIGVDDRVLKKGDLLTPEEYEQMKLHTVIGAEIMEQIEQLKEIVPAIRWHHENWNGRGYPDALKGEEIPLLARIVAVADTFDAVTTSRPYQQAYTLEFAVETITKLTGTRFDAKVVTAFLQAFKTGDVEAAVASAPQPVEDVEPAAVALN